MLEIEGADNDFKADRRIVETVRWLKEFGEQTEGMTLQEINDKLFAEGDLITIARHKQMDENTTNEN